MKGFFSLARAPTRPKRKAWRRFCGVVIMHDICRIRNPVFDSLSLSLAVVLAPPLPRLPPTTRHTWVSRLEGTKAVKSFSQLAFCLCLCLCLSLCVSLCVCLPACLSVCLSVSLSLSVFDSVSLCLFDSVSLSLSVCLSLSHCPWLGSIGFPF